MYFNIHCGCSSHPWDSPLRGLRSVSLPAKRSCAPAGSQGQGVALLGAPRMQRDLPSLATIFSQALSAVSSGSGGISEAVTPPSTGTTQNGYAPANFDGVNDLVASTSDGEVNLPLTAYSISVLFYAAEGPFPLRAVLPIKVTCPAPVDSRPRKGLPSASLHGHPDTAQGEPNDLFPSQLRSPRRYPACLTRQYAFAKPR